MLNMLIPAIIVLAVYVWLVRNANRKFHALRKERFEHTNSAGVLQFDTYEELRKFESREASNQFWINVAAVFAVIASLAEMFS